MILWIILFFIVVAISFVLALQSMRDYQQSPQQSQVDYGLFLIRQLASFDKDLLDSLKNTALGKGLIVSFERLFKGKQAALTIFGPKKILGQFTDKLNLLELEDYSLNLNNKDVLVWEMGVKNSNKLDPQSVDNLFENLPELTQQDQFFWQVVFSAKGGKEDSFQTQIRAVAYSQDPIRQKQLADMFQNFKIGGLVKVPRPYSSEQMMGFYRLRSLGQDTKGPLVDTQGVINLLKV
ncbi:hypothetical protein M1437_03065 [Patescibacteria group bacterium]|nr:hypothetical protein [Patescibacteria group bacterium]